VAAIPAAKSSFHLTEASLGLSLLLTPLGAIIGMVGSRYLFAKMPVGKWMFIGHLLLCIIVVLLLHAPNKWCFWACLLVYGIISFLNGVAVNTTVSFLEAKYGQLFMSTSHAMYSLGGALSAAIVALLFSVGIGSGMQIIIVAILLLLLLIIIKPLLLQQQQIIHSNNGVQLPSRAIMGIAFICLVTFMAEGCVADWSALYFKQVLNTSTVWMSMGYAGFSIAMTIGRLNGDNIIAQLGSKSIVIIGSLLATLGYLLVFAATLPIMAVTGFVLVGIGCSCIVPVLFSASAKIPGISKVTGFAMVSGGGLIGFLVGPSLMGFVAEKTNLSFSFLVLAFITVIAAATAWRNTVLANKQPII